MASKQPIIHTNFTRLITSFVLISNIVLRLEILIALAGICAHTILHNIPVCAQLNKKQEARWLSIGHSWVREMCS